MKKGTEPRLVAATVVGRVMREGAWTQQALSSATIGMTPIDRKQSEGLGYGTIRRLALLDWRLGLAAGRPISEIDPAVLDALRVGAFEVLFGRAPAPVAVSTSVEVVRSLRPWAAGFANAVLRQLSRTQPTVPDPETARAHNLGLPAWLLKSLDNAFGPDETTAFAVASMEDAPVVVRQRPFSPRVVGRPVSNIDHAFEVEPDRVDDHPRQDPSSIAVGLAVGAEPGQLVVDVAAAPGGKTLHLVDQVGPSGHVVALDIHRRRLRMARKRVPEASWILSDGSRPPMRRATFDRVLVDAPCSGLGTLRRRPEIRHRITAAEVERLAQFQRRLLIAGLHLVRPGGRVVYSVCTVTPQETIDVIEGLKARPPSGLPGRAWGGGWLLGPHLTGGDGMFISLIGA